ncbi:MAG TPA: sulfite exporter TauE/SafE family protein [Allocoleopsis sp.]
MSRAIPIAIFIGLVVFGPVQPAIAHPGHGSFLMQNLAQMTLSPTLMLSGMGIALAGGAGHALAPGHGKTMVAAYLVGSRGTPQQAILLGLMTTLTHTISVFALGILVLLFSKYVLPEQVYPLLSLLSGLTICGIGFWLLDKYVSDSTEPHHHHHADRPSESQVTLPSLLAMGAAGGLVPCPSALVLLLSAIALHQTAYGLLLVSAFSFGLAVVLIAIGLTVVYAHKRLSNLPSIEPLQRFAPLVGASAIIVAGSVVTVCAVI